MRRLRRPEPEMPKYALDPIPLLEFSEAGLNETDVVAVIRLHLIMVAFNLACIFGADDGT